MVLAADSAAFQLPGAANGGFCHTPAVAVAERSERLALEMALLAEKERNRFEMAETFGFEVFF